MSEDNCARLEKIQGGVDLINERLKHANELQNERHATLCDHVTRIDSNHLALDGRVVVLETAKAVATGERNGISLAAKALWTIGGGGIVAVVAFIARALGA